MGDFKHLVVAKFKEGVDVEDIIKGMQDLVSALDVVKSFEWGHCTETQVILTQGFTHSFILGFNNKDDYNAYMTDPKHDEYAAVFTAAVESLIVLDFPTVLTKPTNPSTQTAAVEPPAEEIAAQPTKA